MRKIKFRIWDKTDKKMYYSPGITGLHSWFGSFFNESIGDKHAVLMQFTGLKDKNGKEIYESDVLELKKPRNNLHPKNQKYLVKWVSEKFDDGEGWYMNGWKFKRIDNKGGMSTIFDETDIEVIDNIYEGVLKEYENPKLLKEKKNE